MQWSGQAWALSAFAADSICLASLFTELSPLLTALSPLIQQDVSTSGSESCGMVGHLIHGFPTLDLLW